MVKSSKYKGVSLNKAAGKFVSSITLKGDVVHLGSFKDEKIASEAHVHAANNKKYYMGNAKLFRNKLAEIKGEVKPHLKTQSPKTETPTATDPALFPKKKSAHKGVSYRASKDEWVAQIPIKGTQVYLGAFSTEQEAKDMVDLGKEHEYKFNHDANEFRGILNGIASKPKKTVMLVFSKGQDGTLVIDQHVSSLELINIFVGLIKLESNMKHFIETAQIIVEADNA